MDVGRSAPRHQAAALLHLRSTKLQSYFCEYFITVVGFCRYLFKFAQKSSIQQFTSSLSDTHLRSFQLDLEKWASSIREELQLCEAQQNSSVRALTRKLFDFSSNQKRHATNMRVLDFCSTYDHVTAWKQTRKVGNASCQMQQAKYQEWRDGSQSSSLIYTGKLGSGKSVLLANIVSDLSLSSEKERFLIAYFFCKHDVPESLQARTIIGSLARQILCSVSDLSKPAQSCQYTHTTGDVEDVLNVLVQGFPSHTKTYIVLDGLDECNNEEKDILVPAVREIQENFNILFCASVREEPGISLQLITNKLLDTRIISLPVDNPDIEAFIEADLDRCLRQQCLTIGDPSLILEIQDALLKGSQGMFLWVALQIQTLCSMKTDRAIRQALADLPKDLSETFARILKKSGSSDPLLQVKTLQLILAACRPLTTEELREALSVTPGDATWDPSTILNDVHSALACCGCLLSVDEEELTVRVIHHSVKQYMIRGLDNVKSIGFPAEDAQRTMADIVVTYLCYGVFGTELSRAKVKLVIPQSAPSKIVQATVGIPSTARSIAMKLLRSRRQPAFDMSNAIADARGSFISGSEDSGDFKFFVYARTYWHYHVFYVSAQQDAILQLSKRLIHTRALERQMTHESFWTRIQWAAQTGNVSILELLSQAGKLDPDVLDNNGRTPLIRAIQSGDKPLVGVLLNIGTINIEATDMGGMTALHWAAREGHQDVVKTLLTVGRANVEAEDQLRMTPLHWAAGEGHRDAVKALLSVGDANVEAKRGSRWTPLFEAADSGHTDIVKVLLTLGKANALNEDREGRTARDVALFRKHGDIAGLLAEYEGDQRRGLYHT